MRRLLTIAILMTPAFADAGAIVHLDPQTPGPYSPGEIVTLIVSLENDEPTERLLRGVQWDFSQTDDSIILASDFTWQVAPPTGGVMDTQMPLVNWASTALDDADPSLFYVLPGDGAFTVGSFDVQVNDSGTVDAFHADWTFDTNQGAWVTYGFGGSSDPVTDWFAYGPTGGAPMLTGGSVYLEVPEPATLGLLVLGSFALLRRRSSL